MLSRTVLLQGYPATVSRPVVAIVVDPINRMHGRWSVAHIRQEALELPPTSADANAAPTIRSKFVGLRVRASLNHILPASILRCPLAFLRMAMTVFLGASLKFRHQTSTTARRFIAQRTTSCDEKLSTVAEAHPKDFTLSYPGRPLCREASEAVGG